MGYKEPTSRALTADLSCQAIIKICSNLLFLEQEAAARPHVQSSADGPWSKWSRRRAGGCRRRPSGSESSRSEPRSPRRRSFWRRRRPTTRARPAARCRGWWWSPRCRSWRRDASWLRRCLGCQADMTYRKICSGLRRWSSGWHGRFRVKRSRVWFLPHPILFSFFGGDELKASYLKWNGNSLSFAVCCDKKLGKVWRGISSDMMRP